MESGISALKSAGAQFPSFQGKVGAAFPEESSIELGEFSIYPANKDTIDSDLFILHKS